MPNWCSNFVQIRHADNAKLQALADAARAGNFLQSVIPCPDELRAEGAVFGKPKETDEEFMRKYGAVNWYEFCVSRWGTKWDVGCDRVELSEGLLVLSFDSAWSPPEGVYQELYEQGFDVDAMYYEPGMGFYGRWSEGFGDSTEFGGMTADQLEEIIDPDIEEQFGIVESMRQWEEEENEE